MADSPIAADPLYPGRLLLGSYDTNCPGGGDGSNYSGDGGSTWTRFCMPGLTYNGNFYGPGAEPMVGFDHNGVAYIADGYGDIGGRDGLIALQ